MAKSTRPTETIVQAIRQSLAEAAQEGNEFSLAEWSEADADAGYIIHQDGRMVGLGEYQYGFSHIDELLAENLTDEVKGYARSEAGKIAGSIEPVDINSEDDAHGLLERLPYAFNFDADLVENAVSAGHTTIADMFDLLFNNQDRLVMPGQTGCKEDIEVVKDIVVSRLRQDTSGKLSWEQMVAIKAGESVKGFAGSGGYATVNAAGGHISLAEGEFNRCEPQARRTCAP